MLTPIYLPRCSLSDHARCLDEKPLVPIRILNSCFNLNRALIGWFLCFKIHARPHFGLAGLVCVVTILKSDLIVGCLVATRAMRWAEPVAATLC